MKRKIFILFFLFCLLFNSCVFATDADNIITEKQEILSDVYVSEENSLLNAVITGNVFTANKNFELSATSQVSGNLFVGGNTVTLKSEVTYSETQSKDGENSIDSINSKSVVKGNAFIACREFTMEPGSEISGDLYVAAETINIQKSAAIGGNIFAVAKDFTLNGRVQNSVYATCQNFNMSYYGSINNDLHLDALTANLSSVIHRNAFIDAKELETTPDFMLYGNLDAKATVFNYSGETDGNATIISKEFNLVRPNSDSSKCIIKGNLTYSAEKRLNVNEDIIKGEVNFLPYQEENPTNKLLFSIKEFILKLIAFVLYVFVIVWLFVLFAKDYSNTERPITFKNIFGSLGIGLLSILCVTLLTVLLLITSIGVKLAFVLIIAYILIMLLATPLFVLDIARALRGSINFFALTILLALVLFLITQIPYAGGIILFLFKITGTGRLIRYIISKKSILHYKEKNKIKEKNNFKEKK